VHDTTSSKIVRYVISSSTRSYIYEPVPPRDVNNADFLGSSTTTIVFWDAPPSGSGSADLYTWNGNYISADHQYTTDYKEYEPGPLTQLVINCLLSGENSWRTN